MHIFTYGSLMFPDIWRRVAAKEYRVAQATVADYGRFAIRGETYPGMVRAAGQSVQGIVYFDVSQQDVAALDAFEGTDYRRECLEAHLESGASVSVYAYIYLPETRLSTIPWQPEAFQMQRFLDTFCPSLYDHR